MLMLVLVSRFLWILDVVEIVELDGLCGRRTFVTSSMTATGLSGKR